MNNKQVGKVDNVVNSIRANAMEGWHFAKSWACVSSGIMFFFALILFFAIKDVEFSGWRRDCILAVGLVSFGYMVLNVLVVWDTFKFEKKKYIRKVENLERRRFFPGVDDNPAITIPALRIQARVVHVCGHCDRDYTDPPEVLVLSAKDGHKYFQVICPKCWRHTKWCESEPEAEEAWNKREIWAIEDPENA